MDTKEETGADLLLKLLVIVALVPFDGLVGKTLWWWFVVPLGARPIGVIHAAALMVAARYVMHRSTAGKVSLADVFSQMLWWPLIALGVGWVLKTVGI